MVRIPSEYQEVEYIEATGTQYFWTDVDIQDGLTVDSVQTIAGGSDSYLFGGRGDSNTASKTCFNGGYVSRVQGAYPDNYYIVGTVFMNNSTKYHIVSTHSSGRRICVVDGTEVANVATDAFVETTGKCLCFGWNKVGTPSNLYKGKIYSLKVSKASELLANYIPCYRISDNEIGMYDTVSKTFFTNQGTGTFLKGNDVTYDNVNLMESRRRILLNTPHLESLSGSALSFKTDMASKLKECRVHFTPIQEGTGDPSPDNVRPIYGWDGVTVTRCGLNLFSGEIYQEGYGINDSGEITENSVYDVYRQFLKPGTYTVIWGDSNTSANKSLRAVNYDTNGTVIDIAEYSYKTATNRILVFTVSSQVAVTLLSIRSSVVNCRIVKGETDNTIPYEPYTVQSITIPFPQTIYGGYVDLVKGEVVEEWANVSIDELDWTLFTNTKSRQAWRTSGIATVIKKISNGYDSPTAISQSFRQVSYNGTWGTYAISQSSQGTVFLTVPSSSYNTAEEFITALAGEIIVYQLATPTTYSLDPVTIRTLRGLNNIWSDANGDIDIKYWKR